MITLAEGAGLQAVLGNATEGERRSGQAERAARMDEKALLPLGIELDSAFELERRWQGTGNLVHFDLTNKLLQLEIQFRPEASRPKNGFLVRGVRQAFYQATDRQAVVDVATAGVSSAADSWFRPKHELRSAVT